MTTVHVIDQGRELLRRQEWGAAFSKLTAPVDLEGVAKAAYLLGTETEGSEFYRRAHEEFKDDKCVRRDFGFLCATSVSSVPLWLEDC